MPITLRAQREENRVAMAAATLLLVLAAGSGALVFMPGTSATDDAFRGALGSSNDQSLDTIDGPLNPQGAPGAPIDLSMSSIERKGLKDAPAGLAMIVSEPAVGALNSGAPILAVGAAASDSGSKDASLANALKRIAESKSPKGDNGWGAEKARTGFTPPRATFTSLSGGSGSSGSSGGSGASLSLAAPPANAFGVPISNPSSAGTSAGGSGEAPKVRKAGKTNAFDLLKQVERTAGASAAVGGDAATHLGARGYDGSGRANSTIASQRGLAIEGGGITVGEDGVAGNLKLNDPRLDRKTIQVPVVPPTREVPTIKMEEMLMMMLAQVAIAGIAGPVVASIGGGMMGTMAGGSYGAGGYGGYGNPSQGYGNSSYGRSGYGGNGYAPYARWDGYGFPPR